MQTQFRFWGFFVATLAAMVGVLLAQEPIAFLIAWEAMGLFSAGLVAFDHREKAARKATWIYLLACHAGACFLMLAGILLNRGDCFLAAFFCAVVGFGLKIGFPPFHVWLPEAHPAAPAPASALMSGAMIPLGFVGLLRFFSPQLLAANGVVLPCGWTILILGAVGAVGGIVSALPQTNIKKLLAFSSVENMGIVALGFGLAILSEHFDSANANEINLISALASCGAVMHILNHGFLKAGLFLGAGTIHHQTGTFEMDNLGGLMKRMPKTGTLFTLNALGLAGLPPLNGFLSELLIYAAAFHAIQTGEAHLMSAGFLVLLALALSGGLAAAAYCKAIGAIFLGEPRTDAAKIAIEGTGIRWKPQLILFCCSLAQIPGTIYVATVVTRGQSTALLFTAALAGGAVVLLTAILLFVRWLLCPRAVEKPSVPTWDCGYHAPTAKMEYTGTGFTQPLTDGFKVRNEDPVLEHGWNPVFTFFARLFQRVHSLQNGSLHLYILLILISVVLLLAAAFAL